MAEYQGTPYRVVDWGVDGSQHWMIVECQCGNRERVWLWSWSGHGFKRCRVCKGSLLYGDLAAMQAAGGF